MSAEERASRAEQGDREKRRVALASVVAALVLTGGKLVIGLTTNSLGILSEAAHSGLDLVAAAVTLYAVRVAGRPADRDHPYGHGKVENLSALFETLLLLVTCVWIVYEAAHRLFGSERVVVDASGWAFAVVVVSMVIDYSRSRALKRTADKYRSQALEADALHFSTDIWSSAVVLVGLGCVRVADALAVGWLAKADAVAAVGVAVIVVAVSVRLGKKSIDDLLDAVPADLPERVAAAARVAGVREVRQVRVRRAGPEHFADVTVTTGPDAGIERAHDIAHDVEQAVCRELPDADVVVHVEPAADADADLPTSVRRVAHKHGLQAHAIAARSVAGEQVVELHLEVSPTLSVAEAHGLASAVERDLLAARPGLARVITHIEPVGVDVAAHEADVASESEILALLDAMAREADGAWHAHDVTLSRKDAEMTLTFHCAIDGTAGICAAHALTDRIEKRLRERVPALGRVVIHIEPRAR
jgi:cation diffusion facilitator family transporter